jgi:predicted DNA-binding transcriptional regulator AlpA
MGYNQKSQDQPTLWDESHDNGHRNRRPSKTTPPLLPAHRPAKPMDHQDLWNIEDVANYLGVPKQTIYAWRTTGYGPQGFRVGKHLRWRSSTVISWTLGLEQGR